MRTPKAKSGFTIMEVVLAGTILAVVICAILVTTDGFLNAAVDSRNRMRAFETARRNMENILAQNSVVEMNDFGASEKYPDISWETVIEPFYEPITNRMWIQATCSATYLDSESEQQNVTLTNWVTNLSKEDVQKILEQQKREEEYLEELEDYPYGDSAEGLYQHASVLADTGDYYRAAIVVDELVERYPDSDPAEGIKNKIPEWAEKAADRGDYRTASRLGGTVRRIWPSSPAADKVNGNIDDWEKKAETQPERRPEPDDDPLQPEDLPNQPDDQQPDENEPEEEQQEQEQKEPEIMKMTIPEMMRAYGISRPMAEMIYQMIHAG